MTLDLGPFRSFHIFSHNQISKEEDDVLISLPTRCYIYLCTLDHIVIGMNKGHLTRCSSAQIRI